ncbi:MAG: S8 family serine peptidase, partial [Lachnospiraceae bacterium]|nr:S8 family serine peptidase [Lachnospiraceae bacterium]
KTADVLSEVDAEAVELAISESEENTKADERIEVAEDDTYVIRHVVDHTKSTKEILTELYADPDVVEAEPNYVLKKPEPISDLTETTSGVKADTKVGTVKKGADLDDTDLTDYQWYANDATASIYRTPNAKNGDARSLKIPGWNGSEDNASGTLCVMDTGIDITHPDLVDSLYTFTEEQQAKYHCGPNGINITAYNENPDDYLNIRDVTDHMMHGTHIAGIMAAGWNGYGISGVEKGAKVFGVRVFGDDGAKSGINDFISGLEWLTTVAKEVNLKAVNVSLGVLNPKLSDTIMVNKLGALGVNTVYASGNGGMDMDENVDIGGMNNSPYAITVNAANQDGKATFFSCYGQASTDVFAPGAQMLSSVPQKIRATNSEGNLVDLKNYNVFYPENTDPANLAGKRIERFNGTKEVLFFDACPVTSSGAVNKDAKQIGSAASGKGLGFDDENSWSYKPISLPFDTETYMGGNYPAGHSMWMAIPIDDASKANWLSLKVSANDKTHTYCGVSSVMLEITSGSGVKYARQVDMMIDNSIGSDDVSFSEDLRGFVAAASGNVSSLQWTQYTMNLNAFVEEAKYYHQNYKANEDDFGPKDPGEVNGLYVWENNGKKYALAEFSSAVPEGEEDLTDKTLFYVDNVAIGDKDAYVGPYYFLNGTSMAAPTVTAALSIIAKDEKASADLSDTKLAKVAIERKAKLLASVDYDKDLAKLCQTGGRVNLNGKTTFTKKAPLICRATVTGKKLILDGYYFEKSGKIYVDDKKVNALVWKNKKIKADISGLDGGSHVVKVVNKDKAIGRFIFGTSNKDTNLFENNLSLPLNNSRFSKDITDMFDGKFVACKNKLYVLSSNHVSNSIALWCYNTKKDKWS